MSLAKINNFANDDTDILAVQTTVDALYNNSYSLTEYNSTTVPAIAAGSKIEVNGSLYRASSEEAISTTDPVTSSTVADGTVYICMIPSGDASTCTAAFTATAPTWSDSKQGWYGTGDYANYKYIGGCYKSSTTYYGKYLYKNYIETVATTENKSNVFAYRSTNQASDGTVIFNTEVYDHLNEYSTSTGVFTCKKTGMYFINSTVTMDTNATAGTSTIILYIYKNSSQFSRKDLVLDNSDGDIVTPSTSISQILSLDAGDTIYIYISLPYSEQVYGGTLNRTFLNIYKMD